MKINSENYYQVANQIGIENLLPGMIKVHEVIDKVTKGGTDWSKFNEWRDRFEKQFAALEMFMDEKERSPKAETKPIIEQEMQPKPEAKQKAVKPYELPKGKKQSGNGGGSNHNKRKKKTREFEKPKVRGKGVELISTETAFIKRFALLHNKTKTKDQVSAFLRSLQKAIVERRIRKTSKHAKTIMEIQKQLINAYRKMGQEMRFEFDHKDLTRYYKITGAEVILPSIRFIKSFVSLQGKEVTKHKVNNLHSRLTKALNSEVIKSNDKYYKEVRLILNTLKDYLSDGGKSIEISERQLNGLEGVLKECGCQELEGFEYEEPYEEEPETNSGVMSVGEVRAAKFRPVQLTGEWLKLIGPMCLPTSFLIYGKGGSRKTSFALLFMQYLARLGYKILYVASEQFGTPTFTDTLNRLNIEDSENFKIVSDLDTLSPENFEFVVLDSKDDLNLKPESFKNLKKKYPNQTFVLISHGTKSGDFTGRGSWRNVAEVMIYADNGVIKTGIDKNRWGGAGEMRLI